MTIFPSNDAKTVPLKLFTLCWASMYSSSLFTRSRPAMTVMSLSLLCIMGVGAEGEEAAEYEHAVKLQIAPYTTMNVRINGLPPNQARCCLTGLPFFISGPFVWPRTVPLSLPLSRLHCTEVFQR